MHKLLLLISLTFGLYAGTLSGSGSSVSVSNAFSAKSVSLGMRLGSSSIGNQTYTIAGLNVNYFLIDNLSVGLGYEKWFSATPDVQKLTVDSTYYIPASENIRPYAGVLYRHIMISGLNDTNAYGYRVGVAIRQGRTLLSAGIVHERYETSSGNLDGTQTYGEVTIGIAF